MVNYATPGVYIEEVSSGPRPIQAVGTRTAGFVGQVADHKKPAKEAEVFNSYRQFLARFPEVKERPNDLSRAVRGFFENGGTRCWVADTGDTGEVDREGERFGLSLFNAIDEISIVAAPGATGIAAYAAVRDHCQRLRDRVGILDGPKAVEPKDIERLTQVMQDKAPARGGGGAAPDPAGGAPDPAPKGGLRPPDSDRGFVTVYFPWVLVRDPGQKEPVVAPPSGHVAGVWARTDALRGVHKAPANEPLLGTTGLAYDVTAQEQEVLNPVGVNCIRFFARGGVLVWGARTLSADPQWRYLNVRRLFCMIEESIITSTRWVVFEPNDERLWKALKRDVSAFLRLLWRDGALMGRTPEEAFYVKCDYDTNTPDDIDAGRVVVEVGIAPVKPAEFIVFRISQSEPGGEAAEGGEGGGDS
jgi:phage tail sheath protein FI